MPQLKLINCCSKDMRDYLCYLHGDHKKEIEKKEVKYTKNGGKWNNSYMSKRIIITGSS